MRRINSSPLETAQSSKTHEPTTDNSAIVSERFVYGGLGRDSHDDRNFSSLNSGRSGDSVESRYLANPMFADLAKDTLAVNISEQPANNFGCDGIAGSGFLSQGVIDEDRSDESTDCDKTSRTFQTVLTISEGLLICTQSLVDAEDVGNDTKMLNSFSGSMPSAQLLGGKLINTADIGRSKVFYQKMKADYHRNHCFSRSRQTNAMLTFMAS